MLAVTNGFSAVGGVAVASRILQWLERSDALPLLPTGARFNGLSFAAGLIVGAVGVLIFLVLEVWFTLKWALLQWLERPQPVRQLSLSRAPTKPLYKLC